MQEKALKDAVEALLNIPEEELSNLIDRIKEQRSIREEVKKLKSEITKAANRIIDIQNQCEHPNVEKKYRSDTGNWCKRDDAYWIDHACPDCGKHWRVLQ